MSGREAKIVAPEKFVFTDDGIFPNSALPLLVYRQVFDPGSKDLASVFEHRLAANDWSGSWRNG
ncbi:MAG TPA: hypothetical protein VE621_24505, partial [Bryobacteraceae bacterium]|nr:hypothetical protein [Bryobacteraceae bacterium]